MIDKSKLQSKEEMLENEIFLMKMCDHENIVKLYEEFETADEIYLIMEFVVVSASKFLFENKNIRTEDMFCLFTL